MEKFFCLDHMGVTYLDVHGRCQHCNSNALAHPESYLPLRVLTVEQLAEIAELERLMAKS